MISGSSFPENSSAVLQTLCRFDFSPWCFVAEGEDRSTCCSQRFLRLWGLDQVIPAVNGANSADLTTYLLESLLASAGPNAAVLERLLCQTASDSCGELRLTRHDGLSVCVLRVPVNGEDDTPCGSLFLFQPEIPGMVSEQLVEYVMEARQRLKVLSERESQVLSQLFSGSTNKAIGLQRGISGKTVEKHRARIMQKLKVANTAELIRLTSRAMLTELPLQNPPPRFPPLG